VVTLELKGIKMAIQINLRGSQELKERLETAANARGVSVNREINDRLERSFVADPLGSGDPLLVGVLTIVAAAMSAAGWATASFVTLTPEGARQWINNPIAYEQALQAAVQVLRAAAPATPAESASVREDIAKVISSLGLGFANAMLEEAASGKSRVGGAAEKDRAKALNAAAGETLARRFKAGEPREPIILQAAPSILTELSEPIADKKRGPRR
jgi:hypothetical protein